VDDLGHSALARVLANRGRPASVRVTSPPTLRRRLGVITAVSGGGKYASVTLNNSTTVLPNLLVNPAYTALGLTVGTACWVQLNGHGVCDALIDSPALVPDYAITLP
jgi:hypothetical protein